MVHTIAAVRAREGSSFSDFGIGAGRALTLTKIIAVRVPCERLTKVGQWNERCAAVS